MQSCMLIQTYRAGDLGAHCSFLKYCMTWLKGVLAAASPPGQIGNGLEWFTIFVTVECCTPDYLSKMMYVRLNGGFEQPTGMTVSVSLLFYMRPRSPL